MDSTTPSTSAAETRGRKRIGKRTRWKARRLENKREKYEKLHGGPRQPKPVNTMANSLNKIRVAVDLDYEEHLKDTEVLECAKQLMRVHTRNRKAAMPLQVYFTSFAEGTLVAEALRYYYYYSWDIHFEKESYLNVFEKSSIVYLTSDSTTVLQELNPNEVYIIGGLIRSTQTGLSLKRAEELGLRTARLPLPENVPVRRRCVLEIFTVFDILLGVSNGQGWRRAILNTVPPCKLGREAKTMAKEEKSLQLFEERKARLKWTKKDNPTDC